MNRYCFFKGEFDSFLKAEKTKEAPLVIFSILLIFPISVKTPFAALRQLQATF